jgi:hypothetical protein
MGLEGNITILEKRVPKRLFGFPHRRTPFGFHIELFVERVLHGTQKVHSKGSPIGTAKEHFKVLDSTFYLYKCQQHGTIFSEEHNMTNENKEV